MMKAEGTEGTAGTQGPGVPPMGTVVLNQYPGPLPEPAVLAVGRERFLRLPSGTRVALAQVAAYRVEGRSLVFLSESGFVLGRYDGAFGQNGLPQLEEVLAQVDALLEVTAL